LEGLRESGVDLSEDWMVWDRHPNELPRRDTALYFAANCRTGECSGRIVSIQGKRPT